MPLVTVFFHTRVVSATACRSVRKREQNRERNSEMRDIKGVSNRFRNDLTRRRHGRLHEFIRSGIYTVFQAVRQQYTQGGRFRAVLYEPVTALAVSDNGEEDKHVTWVCTSPAGSDQGTHSTRRKPKSPLQQHRHLVFAGRRCPHKHRLREGCATQCVAHHKPILQGADCERMHHTNDQCDRTACMRAGQADYLNPPRRTLGKFVSLLHAQVHPTPLRPSIR